MSGARALDGLAYRMSLIPRGKINLSVSTLCVLELRLISMDGANPDFGIESEYMSQLKEFVSCTFRSVNSKAFY